MKYLKVTALVIVGTFLMTGCMPQTASNFDESKIEFVQLDPIKDGEEVAVIETTFGEIKMRLFPNEAPNTVAHFKKLIGEGFYKNSDVFVDPTMKSMLGGTIDPEGKKGKVVTDDGKAVESEITQNLWHFNGAVSVVGYKKNSFSRTFLSDSRFFIVGDVPATTEMVKQMEEYEYPQKVIDAYKLHGGLPQYTGSFTVFGQVYEGMDIVNKIAGLAVNDKTNKTKEEVKIKEITLQKYTSNNNNSKDGK